MIPTATHVYTDEPAEPSDDDVIAVEQPTERERCYEQARTHLPTSSPDAADTARGASHKE